MKIRNNIFNYFLILLLTSITACSDDETTSTNTIQIAVTDFSTTADEGLENGTILGKLDITVTPEDSQLAYKITSQTPKGAISVSEKGTLFVANKMVFDFDKNTKITGEIEVTTADVKKTLKFTINLNEIPENLSPLIITIDENPTTETSLGILQFKNKSENATFSIQSQTPEDAVYIDSKTGELFVDDTSHFDFETNPKLTGTIQCKDGDQVETTTFEINLNDVKNTFIFEGSYDFSILENPNTSFKITTVKGNNTTRDGRFSIEQLSVAKSISIDPQLGELEVDCPFAFDYERNRTITGTINYTTTEGTVSQDFTIRVQDELDGKWAPLGTGGSNITQVNTNNHQDITVDGNTVYVAYQDFLAKSFFVRKISGNDWVAVGGKVNSGTASNTPNIEVHNNTPYVLYSGFNNENMQENGLTLKKFENNAWTIIGNAPVDSKLNITSTQLIFGANGTPYIGYIKSVNNNGTRKRAFFKTLNESNQWVDYGLITNDLPSQANIYYLGFEGNNLIAMIGEGNSVIKTTIAQNETGLSSSAENTTLTNASRGVSIDRANDGTFYASYIDFNFGGHVAQLDGTTWTKISTQTLSTQTVFLSIYGNTPYLSYTDRNNRGALNMVRLLESKFRLVGNGGILTNVSQPRTAFNSDGKPFIVARSGRGGAGVYGLTNQTLGNCFNEL